MDDSYFEEAGEIDTKGCQAGACSSALSFQRKGAEVRQELQNRSVNFGWPISASKFCNWPDSGHGTSCPQNRDFARQLRPARQCRKALIYHHHHLNDSDARSATRHNLQQKKQRPK